MALTVKSDPARPGGGYALLSLSGTSDTSRIAFEDRSSGLFLAEDGAWGRQPHYFELETADQNLLRIGPEVVDRVEADTPVALHAPGLGAIGTLIWPPLRPSALAADGNRLAARAPAGIEAPPPPPPPPPAKPDERPQAPPLPEPPVPAPATPRSRRWAPILWGLAALILASAAALAWVQFSAGCEGNLVTRLFGIENRTDCVDHARADIETIAYAAFQQCVDRSGPCERDACAEAYVERAPAGAHIERVREKRAESLATCDRDRTQAADFAAFNACVSQTPDPCARKDCVDRYRSRLEAEPFASSLRMVRETAAAACATGEADRAYAAFNACLARSADCDREACASTLPGAVRNGSHGPDIAAALESARLSCSDSRAFADFTTCMDRPAACDRAQCGARLSVRALNGPHARDYNSALESARDACADETVFTEFTRCLARTDACGRAACATVLSDRVRGGPRASDIGAALDGAARDCAAREPPAYSPPPIPPTAAPTGAPSFDCSKASHAAELAICSDGDLAELDQALAQAFFSRRSMLSGEPLRQLIRSEDRWIGYRNATCDSTSVATAKSCLVPLIQARIAELRGF